MATSCEIQQPARSSRTIKINGALPFNEGSNDSLVQITFRQNPPRLNINPRISINRKSVINKAFEIHKDSKKNNLDKAKKIEQTVSDGTTMHPYGFGRSSLLEETNHSKKNSFEDRSKSRSDYRPVDLVSFTEKDILELTTSGSLNFEQIFNNLDIESNNGSIEPFVLRDIGSNQIPADFPVNSFKTNMGFKDSRGRCFLQSLYQDNNTSEFFEESVDVFSNLSSINLKKYNVTQDSIENKGSFKKINYKTTAISSTNSYKPKLLDMSWISDDNMPIRTFVEKTDSIFDDIDTLDGLSIKSSSILNHVDTSSIKIEKKLNKMSTGHTIDYSKSLCGFESIAFDGLLE